ncbi:MAG: hypothetical protein OXB90_11435 [Acidimicrobiaceae bacterium]|nr:hypothetical protein [Acidimicrobiaceae bacterium]
MWLVGDDPASATALEVADVHADIDIRTGATYTYAELQNAQTSFAQELFDAHSPDTNQGAVANSGTSESGSETPSTPATPDLNAGLAQAVRFLATDMESNSMRVAIDPALLSDVGPLGSTSELTFEQSATLVNNLLQPHLDVSYTITDGSGLTPTSNTFNVTAFQGGKGLFPTDASTIADCTSGFTVQTPGRLPNEPKYVGVLTAGHCGSPMPNDAQAFYVNTNSSIPGNEVRLPFVFGYFSANADAQWHWINAPKSGSYKITNEFRCREGFGYPNPYCKVTGTETRTNMMGDFVCHTGINSGISCGKVTSIDGQYTIGGPDATEAERRTSRPCYGPSGQPSVCGRVVVTVKGDFLRTCPGDSGGPVFRGGTAYGIVSGYLSVSDSCVATVEEMYFSAIVDVQSFLSVSVLTNPVTLTSS